MKYLLLGLIAVILVTPVVPNKVEVSKPQSKKVSIIPTLSQPVYAAEEEVIPPNPPANPPTPPTAAPVAPPAPVAQPSGDCASWMAQAGISDPDAVWLIGKESGCRPDAINPSSGACGIPQALPCSKLPCTLQDPVCQLRWMSQYVAQRYGSWSAARAFHLRMNWY